MASIRSQKRLLTIALIVGIGAITSVALLTAPAIAHGNETTDGGNETETAACTPTDSEPELSQARLYAPDTTVEKGDPGQIAGGFQTDPTVECPVVVHITMSVPSGMAIEGASDIMSGGAGMVTAEFTVQPGSNIQDISAQVYSRDIGQRTVTADITYWPEGHQDRNREISGLQFTFDVEEPTEPGDGSSESDSPVDGQGSPLVPIVAVFASLAALAGVARNR